MEPENWASCFGTLAGLFGIIETDEGELVFCGSSWVGRGGLCVGHPHHHPDLEGLEGSPRDHRGSDT